MGETDLTIILPDGIRIPGKEPVVIIGANGSGKTRLSRLLRVEPGNTPEFVNALRSTRISPQLPAMSQLQARQQHDSTRNNARTQPWEIASDFDYILSQLLAEDGDSARAYRARDKAGESVEEILPTALEMVEQLWRDIFPGRRLEWNDWSPVVHNERGWKDWSPVVDNERGEIETYSANQMSDGERAGLYLLAKVLLAQPGQVIVIDEPETHFHARLAVRFWDVLEQTRSDLRFAYVTHDVAFALSREPAIFLLADPRSGLTQVTMNEGLPEEIRREILGAASFSYFASRVVFCEGDDHSFDKLLYDAWFKGRDTVVLPIGSCEDVRRAVRALNDNRLIENLAAVGLVDRDFQPDTALTSMEPGIVVLPVHEVEGLLCLPGVVGRLARHLGKSISVEKISETVRSAIDNQMLGRAALQRTQGRLINQAQDAILSKPASWDIASLEAHAEKLEAGIGSVVEAKQVFGEEYAALSSIRDSGAVEDIVRAFPCKQIAEAIGGLLGMRPRPLFELMARALTADPEDEDIGKLGRDLEDILEKVGLPEREVRERTVTVAAD
jgi:energy-coupling factor transporter ATP-binding protein EcfA2